MVVESLFISSGVLQPTRGDRLNQEQFGEINYDFGDAENWLHLAASQIKLRSGRYRYNAVPI